jgi:hypothetical protein
MTYIIAVPPSTANSVNTMTFHTSDPGLETVSELPSATKKSATKKSRSGRNRALVSRAYGVIESITPAMRAPISTEKPSL